MGKVAKYAAIGGLLVAVPVIAQMMGSIVYDPAQAGNATTQITKAIQEIKLLTDAYTNSVNMYQQIQTNARALNGRQGWFGSPSAWGFPGAGGSFGTANGWVRAINTGAGAAQGYVSAVSPQTDPAPVMNHYAPNDQRMVLQRIGRIQLSDVLGANAMATSGSVRANAVANDSALKALESHIYSTSPADNTQVAVLNTISSANALALRQQQQQLQMQSAALDVQAAAMAERRNQVVDNMNYDVALRQSIDSLNTQHNVGTSAAVQGFRLP